MKDWIENRLNWLDKNITGLAVNYNEETDHRASSSLTLYQNNPNPFSATGGSGTNGNPATKITFSIPEEGIIRLEVFNALGEKVATLVDNEYYHPGKYELEFDGSNYSPGTYYCRLVTRYDFSIKKMLLLK
jgi:hypothetical protein